MFVAIRFNGTLQHSRCESQPQVLPNRRTNPSQGIFDLLSLKCRLVTGLQALEFGR